MTTCPECNEPYPSEAILLRHRQNDHPQEYAAALEAAEGSARAAQEAVQEEEGRFTSDGFLRRTGARREQVDYLGRLFPKPEQSLPPWERERRSGD
jgi:hypothetical protein